VLRLTRAPPGWYEGSHFEAQNALAGHHRFFSGVYADLLEDDNGAPPPTPARDPESKRIRVPAARTGGGTGGGAGAAASFIDHGQRFLILERVRHEDLDYDPVAVGAAFVDHMGLPEKFARGEVMVVVLNLGVHHLIWRHSIEPWLDARLKGFAHGVRQRLESLAAHRQISWVNPNAMSPAAKRGASSTESLSTSVASSSASSSSSSDALDQALLHSHHRDKEGGHHGSHHHRREAPNTVELILLAPSAVHGFREPYVTLPRSLAARSLLARHLVPAGFRLLDATATELARPEMAADGLHYNDAMNYMHAQLLVNMLCNDKHAGAAA